MLKWEYKVQKMQFDKCVFNEVLKRRTSNYKSTEDQASALNILGEAGWELCGVIQSAFWVFKRKL
jgi:hypothetical protein